MFKRPRPVSRTVDAMYLSIALSLAACRGEPPKPAGNAPAQATAPVDGPQSAAPVAKPDDDKIKVIEGAPPGKDDRYALVIEPPTAAVKGKPSTFKVKVTPKQPWHINLDFPTSLKVDAPSDVSLVKTEQKKADAKRLDEQACEYDVAFTANETGDKAFSGTFKFAVCQDEACSPVTENLAVKVAVR